MRVKLQWVGDGGALRGCEVAEWPDACPPRTGNVHIFGDGSFEITDVSWLVAYGQAILLVDLRPVNT